MHRIYTVYTTIKRSKTNSHLRVKVLRKSFTNKLTDWLNLIHWIAAVVQATLIMNYCLY